MPELYRYSVTYRIGDAIGEEVTTDYRITSTGDARVTSTGDRRVTVSG